MNYLLLTTGEGWAEKLAADRAAKNGADAAYTSNPSNGFAQLLLVLFVFVCVLALCYYVTKYLASVQKIRGKGRNLEILEVTGLASGSYLELVKAGKDKYYVLAVSKESVTKIGELTEEEIIEIEEGSLQEMKPLPDTFKAFLDKVKNNKKA